MAIDTTTTATSSASSTTSGTSSTSAASAAADQLGVDYNNFLTLLTAQIKNQDPLQPMDSTQFVSQLAQLSQVEQAVQTNSNLETLNTSVSSIAGLTSLGLVGRSVTVASDKVELINGSAETSYELGQTASSVSATITDDSGTVVRTLTGLSTSANSKIALNWDGKTDAGTQLADGIYHVKINAVDASGKTITYDTYPSTEVNKVDFGSTSDSLELRNGDTVAPGDIVSVS